MRPFNKWVSHFISRGMNKRSVVAACLMAALTPEVVADDCESYPQGLAFMGHSGEHWQIYVSRDGVAPQVIRTEIEPRGFAYHSGEGAIVYIGIGGGIYYRNSAGQEEALNPPSTGAAYAQPAFSPDGRLVYFTEMKDGNSRDTDIVSWDLQTSSLHRVSRQRSAQFEPHATEDHLFYSNVLCVESCGRIIQEIWQRNIVSGVSEQLTLLNHIAKQPVWSARNDRLYFSSNRSGNYHIWAFDVAKKTGQQVTYGNAIDISPAVSGEGTVFFIRRQAGEVNLMCKTMDKAAVAMPLPEPVMDLRSLRISE